MAAVIQNESLLEEEAVESHFELLSDAVLSGVVRTAVGQLRMSAYRGIASVSVLFRGQKEAQLLADIASRPAGEKNAQDIYHEGILRFRKRGLELRIKELTARIERLEQAREDTSRLLAEVSQTKKELFVLARDPLWQSGTVH